MIEKFGTIVKIIRPARPVFFLLSVISFLSFLYLLLAGRPLDQDRYIIPAIVVFLWSLSACAFIDNFSGMQELTVDEAGFWKRLRLRLQRAWYWLIALVFTAATLFGLALSYKLVSIWLKDYAL